jgi:Ser/Thr protein kinase RdoA (MazF antagonist)
MEPIAAAVAVAVRNGVAVDEPVMLRSTNNTVAHLPPSPLVVKVSDGASELLAYELAAGSYLSQTGAPVAAPDPALGGSVHQLHEFSMTFWRYLQPDPDPGDRAVLAEAIGLFHERATGFKGLNDRSVPRYDDAVNDVRRRLHDPGFASALTDHERTLICTVLDSAQVSLDGHEESHRVLHGSPHGYNVIWVSGDPVFVDLESVCTGPVEWDLAYTDPMTAAAYPGVVDAALLQAARSLVAGVTAAWYMEGIDRGPDMEWHARNHLRNLEEWDARTTR